MSDSTNHRRFYRLQYPEQMMPTATIGQSQYAVAEISEGGMRIRCAQPREFRIGATVDGLVTFEDGQTIEFSGVIYRRDETDYVIAPLEGVSFKLVVAQQQQVLSQFAAVVKNSD
jgi:c-di-GMP-binding flagellar brake protein YcgR